MIGKGEVPLGEGGEETAHGLFIALQELPKVAAEVVPTQAGNQLGHTFRSAAIGRQLGREIDLSFIERFDVVENMFEHLAIELTVPGEVRGRDDHSLVLQAFGQGEWALVLGADIRMMSPVRDKEQRGPLPFLDHGGDEREIG